MNFEDLQTVLNDIKYKDWNIEIKPFPYNCVKVTIGFIGVCNFTKKPIEVKTIAMMHLDQIHGRDVVEIIKHRIINMEVHEALECFRYKGEAIFNPHK